MGVEGKRTMRTRFMRWLYDTTDGDERTTIDVELFRNTLKPAEPISINELNRMITFLEGERLVAASWTVGWPSAHLQITHQGVVEVEDGELNPEKPTEHFEPFSVVFNSNVVHVATADGAVMNASPGAHQHIKIKTKIENGEVRGFIEAARLLAAHAQLAATVKADMLDDLDQMEKELSRPEPRPSRLAQSGRAIVDVFTGAGGSLVAAAATPQMVQAIDVVKSSDWSQFG